MTALVPSIGDVICLAAWLGLAYAVGFARGRNTKETNR